MGDEKKYPPGFTPDQDTAVLPKGFIPDQPVKKKDGGIASRFGGVAGTSEAQSEGAMAMRGMVATGLGKQPTAKTAPQPILKTRLQETISKNKEQEAASVSDYLYGLKTQEEKQLAKDTPELAKQRSYQIGQERLANYMGNGSTDPLGDIQVSANKKTDAYDMVQDFMAAKTIEDFTPGSEAKKLLGSGFTGSTKQLIETKAAKYDKIAEPFRQLGYVNYTDQRDFGTRWRIQDAAIKAYANKNPLFAKQMEAAGIDLKNGSDFHLKLGDKTGQVVGDILSDEDFADYIENENPNLYNSIKLVADNLLTDNKAFGANVVANEISRERQKLGFNNPIVEFDDKNFRKENDLVAQNLYANDPQKMQIYNEIISQDPDKYIDTPNLLESFAHGAEGVYKGIGSSFAAPFTPISKQIKESWKQEANHVTADPKGINKFMSGTGHVLGLVAALGGVSNVLGAGGTGVYSKNIAPFVSGTVPFAGDFLREGITKYPDSPVKAGVSAGLNTILYGALSQRIFPAKQVQEAFSKVKPEIGKIVENLASGKITREVARQEANTLLKQGFDFIKGTTAKSAKISAELTGIAAANRAFDKLFMDKEGFEQIHPDDELQDSFKTLFLDNFVLGGITKYSEMRKGNAVLEESLYEAATNPLRYKRIIDEMEVKDPTISKENMLSNLGFLSAVKMELDSRGVSERNQKRYLLEAAQERAIKEERAKLPESNLTRRQDANLNRASETKEAILNNEPYDGQEPQTAKEVIQSALKSGELKGMYAELAEQGNEESVLQDIAQQAQNLNQDGTPKNDGQESASMKATREQFGDTLVDEAIRIYPKKEVGETQPEEQTGRGEPPVEPPPSQNAPEFEPGKNRRKGILNRLYEAKNVPQAAKDGFEREGLDYKTASKEEAAKVAKSVVDEFGVDEAVALAERQTFDGDVNSLIFAESLNKLYEEGQAATTPKEKMTAAERFKEVAIAYDKAARSGGRFNSAINHFYKKSPLGVVLYENANRKSDFDQWAKPKYKSWKEFYDELMKEPEFESIVKEQAKEQDKQQRAEKRAARMEKVRNVFKEAKDKFKKGGTYATIIPPHIMETVLEAMELAYEAGEAVTKIIGDAIDSISQKIGTTSWDKDKFRKEWEGKLKESGKKPLTDEELKAKVIDKFRKKLTGLSEKQKEDVIRKSHQKLIENGALEYADLRAIIAQVTGRGELTESEATRMKELVQKTNALDDAAQNLRNTRTKEAQVAYTKTELEAAKAQKELSDLFYNKPDITKRLTSIMQLSTLGLPSLVNNPIYNIWNQAALRFPIGVINDLVDRGITRVAKMVGKNYEKEYNIFAAQKGFWEMLGVGAKEAIQQVGTGLNRQDYLNKEIVGQNIRPLKAWRDLVAQAKGKKKMTKKQTLDKALQATVGIPAEIVARLLNIGDKPQRFGAEGATASQFANTLGLKGIDYDLFLQFPREEAYTAYKALGYSDAEAGQKADYVKEAIQKEGMRSTFQQDNLLTEALTRAFSVLGGKDSGTANLAKTLTVSPYVKIPSNAFWSFYNLLNPEIAMLQSMVHGVRSARLSKKGETTKSKLATREARYWAAHAMVGIATRAVVISLLKSGIFTPSSDDDDSKKEREAVSTFDKAGTIQIGDKKVSNRWFGQFGMMANAIAKKYRDSTPEQREKQDEFWNTVLGGMELDGLAELENGIFANSSSLLQFIDSGNPDRYLTNTLNMFTNIIHPATAAQFNRAALNEVPSNRGDNLLDKINQQMAQRSTLYRWATGTEVRKKRDMWGQTIPKGGNTVTRAFGISKADPKVFARPMYEDFVRTGDSGFLPPTVTNVLNGQKLNTEQLDRLEMYVGNERRKMMEPYINDMSQIPVTDKLYSQLDDTKKKEVLSFLYSEGRERGLQKFYSDYPQLKPKEKSTYEMVDDKLMEATKQLIKINQ